MQFIMKNSKFLFQAFFVSVWLIPESNSSSDCSRGGSRLVRRVLNKNFYPIFESYGADMPEKCPLRRSRDLYHIQEEHKTFENNARWSCKACGKAFYREEYLDLHMENKHQDLLVKNEHSPVCLADYCQLFRCDALNKEKRNKHFWSKALCNAENMAKLKKKCLSLVKSCIPVEKSRGFLKQVYNEIIEETCSLINCKDYWKPLDYELSVIEVLYYLTFTPIFIFALGIYYYNIWEYYYGDEAELREAKIPERKSSTGELSGLRKRHATSSRFTY